MRSLCCCCRSRWPAPSRAIAAPCARKGSAGRSRPRPRSTPPSPPQPSSLSRAICSDNRSAASLSRPGWLRSGIVPPSARSQQRVGLFRAPGAAPVNAGPMVFAQDGIDHRPRRLDRVLAREQRAVTAHGIAQQALVRWFLPAQILTQEQFLLLADELLPRHLYPRRQCDGRIRGATNANVVRAAIPRLRVLE